MFQHDFKAGDRVRITNVASHMYGPDSFDEGDISVVLSAEPLMGFIPGVLVKATKSTVSPGLRELGVPFASIDLNMLTKVEG